MVINELTNKDYIMQSFGIHFMEFENDPKVSGEAQYRHQEQVTQ